MESDRAERLLSRALISSYVSVYHGKSIHKTLNAPFSSMKITSLISM